MKNLSTAQRKLGFRIHAITFVPGMVLMFIINYFTGKPYWVLWVLLGWGVGLLGHWVGLRIYLARHGST